METYYGQVRTPVDAIKLFEACRLGLLPRVQRRLSEKERQAIRSGSVFVWDEREAGMRRWTDGKSWSASRVSGSFLTYREMEGKRGNAFGGGSRRGAGKTPDSGRGSDEDQDDGEPDGYRYKPDGLMKQSFSITTSSGQHLHLIAYYARGNVSLPQPSTDISLRHITPAKGMYPESSLNETPVPALTRTPMQPAYPPHHHLSHLQPPHHQHPQHHPAYATQYPPHLGYAWPPSPVGTPPYSHGHYTYSQAPPHPHGPPQAYSAHPQHPYLHHGPPHPGYERAPLPLPHPQPHPQLHQQPHLQQVSHQHALPHPQLPSPMQPKSAMPLPQPYPQIQQHPSQAPRPPHLGSPRAQHMQAQHLQAQAREAVQIDPRIPPGPLPAPILNQPAARRLNGASPPRPPPLITTTTSASATTPPMIRSLSASPPRSAGGKGSTVPPMMMMMTRAKNENIKSERLSLSVSELLHPPLAHTPSSSSDPGSAHSAHSAHSTSGNGNSPPHGSSSAQERQGPAGEDARVVGVLNKRFYN